MKRVYAIAALALSALFVMAWAASAAVAPGTYHASFNYAAAPTGTHLATGTAESDVTCTVDANLNVTCPTTVFDIEGVGHTDATALLSVVYSATVDCRNHGGNVVETHSQLVPVTAGPSRLRAKNGRLTVTQLSTAAPTNQQLQAQATCPNPNWTAEVRTGTKVLASFTYTVTFDGFNTAFITISAP
jgi:hypothetical protein